MASGHENLIPFNKRTEDEQRRIASEGGKASGQVRRRKRALKEAADLYLSLPVSDQRRWNKLARKGIDTEDIDNQMAMIVGLTEAATAGDSSAANVIVKLLGEDKPQSDSDFEDVVDIRREVFGDE